MEKFIWILEITLLKASWELCSLLLTLKFFLPFGLDSSSVNETFTPA